MKFKGLLCTHIEKVRAMFLNGRILNENIKWRRKQKLEIKE